MSTFSDQRGKPLSETAFFQQLSEAILANVIALYEGGVSPDDVRLVVGADGGTVVGGGAVFQTPVAQRLTEDHAQRLYRAVGDLLTAYDAGRVPAAMLAEIRARHNVERKVEAVRAALSEEK